MNRHRFVGKVGEGCLEFGSREERCGQEYSAAVHYTDTDHPYTVRIDEDEVCSWSMQAVPGDMFCGWIREADVHRCDRASDTLVMQTPVAEPPFPEGRVYGSSADAPAEDGVPWAFTPRTVFKHMLTDHNLFKCPHPDCVRDSQEARSAALAVDEGEDPVSPAQRAAELLAQGQVLAWGPWPVRQFYWGSGEAASAASELVRALADLGMPFLLETWYLDPQTQLARLTWAELLGLGGAEVVEAVRLWPS